MVNHYQPLKITYDIDDRQIPLNLLQQPEKYLGKIIAGNEFGTCFAVAENCFLTVKHVIKNSLNETYDVNECRIVKGLHEKCGNNFPEQGSLTTYTVQEIKSHLTKDMALVKVSENIDYYCNPDLFKQSEHKDKMIRISGYSQKFFGNGYAIECPNTVFSGTGIFKPELNYQYTADTYFGSSGSPIAICDVNQFYIVGVHTDYVKGGLNSGILFTQNDINWIKNNV